MSANLSGVRHVRGFDFAKPLSITVMIGIMLPLILLPLASIFIFGTSKGLASFWSALSAPEAVSYYERIGPSLDLLRTPDAFFMPRRRGQ